MPMLDEEDQQDRDNAGVEILGDVRLVSFTASPDHIGPFGASHLAWRVEGPVGFHVRLGFVQVQKTGGSVVQPAVTTTYRLSAQAGQATKALGQVTVTVDGSGCEIYEPILKPSVTLRGALKSGVLNQPGIYLRSEPAVSFSPATISFKLRLAQSIDWFPDPDIDIDGSFGVAVADGELVSTGALVTADATVPWYAWATPGAVPALAIALDGAKEKARKSGLAAVEGLVELLNVLSAPPNNKRLRSVRIDAGNGGYGVIELTACPYDLLRRFAELSAVTLST
jgi:hypothetical protein